MACLDMYNSEHNGHHHHHHHHCSPMSPRISFSNDFVDAQHAMTTQEHSSSRSETSPPPPVSSDFEFSVTNYSMMSADELFSKGRLLPFKDNCNKKATTTLREELLVGDEDDDGEFQEFSPRPPKGSSSSTRWKGFLGLRKSHIGSKKVDKSEGSSETRSGLINDRSARLNLTSQELLNEGGSNCRNVEIGI
ncbi:hypothetical protein RIF29_33930 [Crotalaria pallida]|uniref:Uncharacterized protein n=1 Tax=Crotalaria pallida TaxID=3830 RepID=A0AAN9E9K9_CROPI